MIRTILAALAIVALAILASLAPAYAGSTIICNGSAARIFAYRGPMAGMGARIDAAQAKGPAALHSLARTLQVQAASLAAGLRYEATIFASACPAAVVSKSMPDLDAWIGALDNLASLSAEEASRDLVVGP